MPETTAESCDPWPNCFLISAPVFLDGLFPAYCPRFSLAPHESAFRPPRFDAQDMSDNAFIRLVDLFTSHRGFLRSD